MLDPGLDTTSMCLRVGYGARFDPVGRSGTAHFLEHLLFSCPVAGRLSFVEHVERLGAAAGAKTDMETTLYYTQTAPEDAQGVAELLLRSVLRPVPDPQLFETERDVVVRELQTAEADPSDHVQDVAVARLFPGHPLSRPVGGIIDEVRALTPERVDAAYRELFLTAPRALVVVGPRPLEGLQELLDEPEPGPEPGGAGAGFDTPPLPLPDLSVPAPALDSELAWVCLAGRSAHRDATGLTPETYGVLSALLGSSPSSLLHRKLRVEEPLSYTFESWNRGYTETGVWRVLAGVEPRSVGRVVEIVDGLLADVAEGRVPETDLDSARRGAAMRLTAQAESTLERARLIAIGSRGGTVDWSVADGRSALLSVSSERVAQAARALRGNLAVAVLPVAA